MPVLSDGPTCQTNTIPMRCSRCGDRVFFLQCTCGSRVIVNDLDTFEKHNCDDVVAARRSVPVRDTRLHVVIKNPKGLPDFEREMTNAVRGWNRQGVVTKKVPIRNRQFEIWLMNNNEPEVLDQITNLFIAGFTVDSKVED